MGTEPRQDRSRVGVCSKALLGESGGGAGAVTIPGAPTLPQALLLWWHAGEDVDADPAGTQKGER